MVTACAILREIGRYPRIGNGDGRAGGGGNNMGLLLHTSKIQFFYLVVQNVYIILLYGTLCTNTYFLRYRQLDVGGVEVGGCSIRDRNLNTVLNHFESALDMQNFT